MQATLVPEQVVFSVRSCPRCGRELTVVNTTEQVRRPFTPQGMAVVQRERVCKGGTKGHVGDGCGYRSWSEEYVTAEATPLLPMKASSNID